MPIEVVNAASASTGITPVINPTKSSVPSNATKLDETADRLRKQHKAEGDVESNLVWKEDELKEVRLKVLADILAQGLVQPIGSTASAVPPAGSASDPQADVPAEPPADATTETETEQDSADHQAFLSEPVIGKTGQTHDAQQQAVLAAQSSRRRSH